MEVLVNGPVGRLEARLDSPEGEPRGAAIVCHPHPVYGGTLDNTVVYRTARALRSAGLATLRFNFRGVGRSEGEHDGEGAEEEDARACLDFLEGRYPGLALWAAGFSFGARTVCGLAVRDERIERLVLVALPVTAYPCRSLDSVRQPGLLIVAEDDEFGTPADLAARHPDLPEGLRVVVISGADHMFRGRTPRVEERVREYAEEAWKEVS